MLLIQSYLQDQINSSNLFERKPPLDVSNMIRKAVHMENKLIPVEVIERKIFMLRGEKVMLSMHLAELYEVETRALNQAVKRNIDRFPEDCA